MCSQAFGTLGVHTQQWAHRRTTAWGYSGPRCSPEVCGGRRLGRRTEKEAERLCVSGSGAGRVVVKVDGWIADRAEEAPARFSW
jgi:hypothetical protein